MKNLKKLKTALWGGGIMAIAAAILFYAFKDTMVINVAPFCIGMCIMGYLLTTTALMLSVEKKDSEKFRLKDAILIVILLIGITFLVLGLRTMWMAVDYDFLVLGLIGAPVVIAVGMYYFCETIKSHEKKNMGFINAFFSSAMIAIAIMGFFTIPRIIIEINHVFVAVDILDTIILSSPVVAFLATFVITKWFMKKEHEIIKATYP